MKSTIKFSIAFAIALFFNLKVDAQVKMGNNPTTLNANAELELESTNRGLLLPRLALSATTNFSPLTAHIAGMTVYNTATTGDVVPAYYYNDGTKWVQIATSSDFWALKGNSGTTPPTAVGTAVSTNNFWGTKDAQNLAVGVNGTTRMIFDQKGNSWGGGTGNTMASDSSSLMWGSNNKLYGYNSIVAGNANIDSSRYSAVFGWGNTLGAGGGQTNRGTILSGGGNVVTGSNYNSIINGSQVTVRGACFESIITGFQTTVTNSQKVVVSGQGHTVTNATGSAVLGNFNTVSAGSALVSGAGNNVNAGGDYGVALGEANAIAANHRNSMVVGKGTTTTASAQYVSGFAGGYKLYSDAGNSVGVSLAASGTSWASISDKRSKDNIKNINHGLSTVMQLRPTMYNYKGQKNTSLGFIAQEVKEIMPEVVEKTTMGPNQDYLGIKYTEMIPVLTKAIQELKTENDALKAKNVNVEKELACLKSQLESLSSLSAQVKELQALMGVKKSDSENSMKASKK